jgi:hypothetical protein
MELIQKALDYEKRKLSLKTFNDRIIASRELKALILGINEFYKKSKDPELMAIMKRLTAIKRHVEKRLNYKVTV